MIFLLHRNSRGCENTHRNSYKRLYLSRCIIQTGRHDTPMWFKILLTTIIFLSITFSFVYAQADTIVSRYRIFLVQTTHIHPNNIQHWSQTITSTGQWPDIDYTDKTRANWQLWQHLKRLDTLAVAWSNPVSSFYHNKKVWKTINLALNNWLKNKYQNPNWWHNQIGVPQSMRNIIVLLKDTLSNWQLQESLKVMNQLKVQKNGYGANTIWSADLGFHYGVLTHDPEMIDSCRQIILNEIHISKTTRQGIQPDYSFHQHGSRLQMYQYGKAYLFVSVRLAWELRNTQWAFPERKKNILINFILNGWQWMARGINTVPGTMDRSASRIGELRSPDIRYLVPFLIELAPGKTKAFKQLAMRQNGKESLEGFRYFPYSDFAVYQNEKFSFFVKTISTRTLPTEVGLNSENLKGRLLNSGDAYLIQNGREYYNMMPVWNWQKLPGITAFKSAYKIERKPFVGSVSNGEGGLTAMDYCMENKAGGQKVTAHKIWACHKNVVVCLIADLNTDDEVYTVLDQCRLQSKVIVNNPKNEIEKGTHKLKNVNWIWHHGFAYLPARQADRPLEPEKFRLRIGKVTGNWYSINASEPDSLITDSVFMPVMLHNKGINHTGYVLAYCKTPKDAAAIYQNPDWAILQNDKNCQAVQFEDGTIMAAFFDPGQLKTKKLSMKVDKPCLILISRHHLHISDPSHQGGMLTISLNNKRMKVNMPADGTTQEVKIER